MKDNTNKSENINNQSEIVVGLDIGTRTAFPLGNFGEEVPRAR